MVVKFEKEEEQEVWKANIQVYVICWTYTQARMAHSLLDPLFGPTIVALV